MKHLPIFLILALFIANKAFSQIQKGTWRAVIERSGHELPFGLDIQPNTDGKTCTVHVINGSERLKMDDAFIQNDSLHIPMYIFDSDLVAKVNGNTMSGFWKKKRNGVWVKGLPFRANLGDVYWFDKTSKATSKHNVSGKYATYFLRPERKDSSFAVGILEQKGTTLAGTFLTPTGDYRYLAGNVIADSLFLSCFDGSHVYLFRAAILPNGTINGGLWAGISGYQPFVARPDANAALPAPTALTFLKPGYETLDFSFPDTQGKMVSLNDARFKNRVVVLQISGTWCPNCMDETRFLVPWLQKNQARGVEVVGLFFERSADLKVSGPKIDFMAKRFGITYPTVLAGTNDANAGNALPALNGIKGYPTTIFIDKKGKVREIHTGFSGPGTGKYYDEFVVEFNQLINKLLVE
ncbi:MAG: TlpA family protein disulfide reductase [Runella slithyformis]|nr:MAG: TlpA family protein disulfide reductase [Runella slithyformis]TAF94973.1 MAG: TlpA family protein disulfide reductase [Runella sp.]TAG18330.1 MAG: TlpA family protein disulfide reductase [Cytophagales bacterium]TAG37826.1 MAG: TlpA family protein disulfide reductase [Cytophagia bacterium]TAG50570.1 MAG: TlpA family protein disulfide reductase [Runella slithyformis]